MILAGDTNIDLPKQDPVSTKYTELLTTFKLTQVIREPTRQGKTLIDHIATNIPKKVAASGVLPCPEISDHDAPYIIVNIRVTRFIPRFKYIRYDKLGIFNDLVQSCLDKHMPLIRIQVTRPPALWMKDLNIRQLQAQRDTYHHKAHQSGSECDWQRFRNVRNQLKKIIKETKKSFYQNALSSKRSKVVWSTIHRILYPNPKPINEDPEKWNVYFANLVE